MKKFIARVARKQRGTVFITTMVTMLLMVLTGSYFFAMSNQSLAYVKSIGRSMQAKYLADSGLARMYSALSNSFSTATSYSNQTLGLGVYSASIQSISGRYLVSATGTTQGVSRISTAEVIPPTINALNYVLAAGGNNQLDAGTGQSSGTITGDIYSAGNTQLDGPSSGGVLAITGNVQAGGSISSGSNVTVSGSQTPSYSSSVTFPTADFSYYQTIAQANGAYYAGNVTYNNSSPIPSAPTGGVIYVNGNITINGAQSTTACMVATGNIQISKSGSVYPQITVTNANNYPAFLVGGNFQYSSTGNGNGYLNVTGLLFTNGNIQFDSANHETFTLNGSMAARGNIQVNPTAWSTITVNYVAQNPPGFNAGSSQMTIASYNS